MDADSNIVVVDRHSSKIKPHLKVDFPYTLTALYKR